MRTLVIIAFLVLCNAIQAQQLQQVSQFMLNHYAINTAEAGRDSTVQAKLLNRVQWTGITDAPRTLNLSVYGMTKNPKIGIGGLLYSDIVGPTRRNGARFSYAYHLNLNSDWKLGLSAGMGVLQFAIDGTRITLDEDDDPALFNQKRSQVVFDANFSALAYRDNFYFGVTLPQLLQNRLDLFDSVLEEENKLEDHYYISTGYAFSLSNSFTLEPHVLIKYVKPAPLKVDVAARVVYDGVVWLGGSFRSNDALSAFVGYNHNDQVSFGYSYDFTTSAIKSFTDGTHELTIGFKMYK